jgi:hypothetical protein
MRLLAVASHCPMRRPTVVTGLVPPPPSPKPSERGARVPALSIALKRPELTSYVWEEEFVSAIYQVGADLPVRDHLRGWSLSNRRRAPMSIA